MHERKYEAKKPVVVFIYKREEKFRRIIKELRKVKPKSIFVVGDGPKATAKEKLLVEKTRRATSEIDWACEVKTNFSERNMGGPERIPSGLRWVFEHVREVIVLEDDVLPSVDFFLFSELMLDHYRYDTRVMQVSGWNRGVSDRTAHSYYFGTSPRGKGWATWKRAWEKMDSIGDPYPTDCEENLLRGRYSTNRHFQLKKERWEAIRMGAIKNWDLIWDYVIAVNNGLVVVPNVNLTRNIGFDEHAQHAKEINPWAPACGIEPISYPLIHPSVMVPNIFADHACYKLQTSKVGRLVKIGRKLCSTKNKARYDKALEFFLPPIRRLICDPWCRLKI